MKLTSKVLQYLVTVENDTILYFMDTTPEALMPKSGQIISSGATELLPKGINGRVTEVSDAHGLKRCVVGRLPLEEVFKTLRVEIHGPVDWSNASTVDRQGNVIAPAKGTRANTDKEIYKMDWGFLIESTSNGKSNSKYTYNGKDKKINMQASMAGMMGKVDFNANINATTKETVHLSVDLSKYSIKCSIEEASTITTKLSAGKGLKGKKALFKNNNEGKKIRLLNSPVAIDFIYGIDSELQLDLNTKMDIEAQVESNRNLGFEFVNKSFKHINENLTKDQDVFRKIDVAGLSNTAIKATARLGIDVPGWVTGTIGAGLTTGMETMLNHTQSGDTLQLNDNNYIKLYLNSDCDIDMALKFKGLKLYDYKKKLDETNIFKRKWPLFPSLLDMAIAPRDITDKNVSFNGQFSVSPGLIAKLGADIKPFLRLYDGDKFTDFTPEGGSKVKVTADGENRFNFDIKDQDKTADYEAVPGIIYGGNKYIFNRKEFAQPLTTSETAILLQGYKQLYGDKKLTPENHFAHEYIYTIDAKLIGGDKVRNWGILVKMLNSKGRKIMEQKYDVDKKQGGVYTIRFTLFSNADPTCRVAMQPYCVTTDDKTMEFKEYEYELLNPAENLLDKSKDIDIDFGG